MNWTKSSRDRRSLWDRHLHDRMECLVDPTPVWIVLWRSLVPDSIHVSRNSKFSGLVISESRLGKDEELNLPWSVPTSLPEFRVTVIKDVDSVRFNYSVSYFETRSKCWTHGSDATIFSFLLRECIIPIEMAMRPLIQTIKRKSFSEGGWGEILIL